jgi:hypothetical protein
LALLLNGCLPIPQDRPNSNNSIARIDYRWGENAFINGNKARQGAQVYSGDNVSTKAATSVSVAFNDGGFMQLDANTDPDFQKWFEMGRCIIEAFVQFGQVYVETGNRCDFLIDDGHLEAIAHTKFNLEVHRGYSVLSVIQGEIQLRSPKQLRVSSNQQLTVYRNGHTKIKPLSQDKIQQILQWRKPVENKSGWCCTDGRISRSTPLDCRQSRGSFNSDYRTLERSCRIQRNPQGYCCINGNVSKLYQSVCTQRNGQFYGDASTARRYCSPPKTGWCCSNRNVFALERERCLAIRGQYSDNEAKLRRECRPLIRINPTIINPRILSPINQPPVIK